MNNNTGRNSVLAEQLVKDRRKRKRALLRLGAAAGGVAVMLLAQIVLPVIIESGSSLRLTVNLFVIAGVCFGVYSAFRMTNVEYEYAFFDGEMDITKILGQVKRKPLYSFPADSVQLMAPATEANLAGIRTQDYSVVDATSDDGAPGRWFIMTEGAGKRGLIFFEPREKILGALRLYVPRRKIRDT